MRFVPCHYVQSTDDHLFLCAEDGDVGYTASIIKATPFHDPQAVQGFAAAVAMEAATAKETAMATEKKTAKAASAAPAARSNATAMPSCAPSP